MNYPAALDHSGKQCLNDIYQQEFVALKTYVIRLVRNEQEAETIVGKCFAVLAGELMKNAGRFPSLAHAKACLVTTIRHECFAWLRKDHPASVVAPAEAMADDPLMMAEFVKHHRLQQLLPLIAHLPKYSQQEAILLSKKVIPWSTSNNASTST